MKPIIALFLVALGAFGSIHDVDFKNFAYPIPHRKFIPVPAKLRWMPPADKFISLRDGRYKFPCGDDSSCPSLEFNQVDFGHIKGIPGSSALVSVRYYTGGTATWQYLYVIALRSEKPRVEAWLETGSRADMGLRSATVERGDLVLIVEDPDKRMGDCCSTGTITYRYQWLDGSFRQIGTPIRANDPPQ